MMGEKFLGQVGLLAALAVVVVALGACNGGGGEPTTPAGEPSPGPSPAVTATAEATPTPALEDQVSEAYLDYWQVYADAVFDLDETRLTEAMTGQQLERTRQEIESLRQKGRAAKIVVEHDFFIVDVDPVAGTARIRDQYANRSYEVDAETKEMIGEAAPGTLVTDTYLLVKEGETWKVRDGIRQGD